MRGVKIGLVITSVWLTQGFAKVHVVKEGETLSEIAQMYEIDTATLKKLNKIEDAALIRIGQKLIVDQKESQKSTKKDSVAKKGKIHSVKSGETLSQIAELYGLKTAELLKLNNIDNPALIRAGQKLIVARTKKTKTPMSSLSPVTKKKKKKATVHVVKEGETLLAIAQAYGIDMATLKKLNNIDNPSYIKAGQRLALKADKKEKRAIFKKKRAAKKRVRVVVKKNKIKHRFKDNKRFKVVSLAKSKLGRRYVWGAQGRNTFDCSGLTSYVYKKVGVQLPRVSRRQARFGKYVPRHKLKPGDLVFFDTNYRRRGIDHVGIYIGNGKFIHASSAKKRVIITSINKPFYRKRYRGARRVL